MYLKQAVIENSGSLRWFNVDLGFSVAGLPKPLILVGGNGGGKTNFLATVADALFEAAAVHYDNVLSSRGTARAWFRIVGGRTLTAGTLGGFSLLRFEDAGENRFFREKTGQINITTASTRVPSNFVNQLTWPEDGSLKEFGISDERSRIVFAEGAYTYFPSNRSEVPYWLNREAIPEVIFDTAPKFSKRLIKPIYVEHALEQFKQWLIGLLADARVEIISQLNNGNLQWSVVGDPSSPKLSSGMIKSCNTLLQDIMSDPSLRLVWTGRKTSEKVAIVRDNQVVLSSLDALSAGQSILLGMFGTILRYGDMSQDGSDVDLASIEGICIIDEVDAHVHIELQHKILPKIIKRFPKVQFILSSHSPLFVLGMEKEFGSERMQVIEMPNGVPVGAESYREFGTALEALAATSTFTAKVVAEARKDGKPIVYVEGETDAPYLKRAAVLRGRVDLLERCAIEWIGAKDEGGQAFHTGKDALKHTLSVLRANPKLASRNILLLYDNDINVVDQDYDGFSVRKMPINPDNKKVLAGIENLLSEDCIEEAFYRVKATTKPNGDTNVSRTLRKAELCESICLSGTREQFAAFDKCLDIIERYLL